MFVFFFVFFCRAWRILRRRGEPTAELLAEAADRSIHLEGYWLPWRNPRRRRTSPEAGWRDTTTHLALNGPPRPANCEMPFPRSGPPPRPNQTEPYAEAKCQKHFSSSSGEPPGKRGKSSLIGDRGNNPLDGMGLVGSAAPGHLIFC